MGVGFIRWVTVAISAALLGIALTAPARAVPIISATTHTTDRFAFHSVPGLPVGNKIQVAGSVLGASTADPFGSLTVLATQGATTISLTFFPFTAPIIVDPVYLAFINFDPALTGSWSITAADSTGAGAAVLTAPIAQPQFLPFVTGITVSDATNTPTVSWSLPDLTGFDVDQSRIRVIEAATGVQVFQTQLALAVTSFTVPTGILEGGKTYVYRISLEDLETDPVFLTHVENRSNAFSAATRVPEPGMLALMAAATLAAFAVATLRRARRAAR